jgi:hypothetical protein
VVRLALLFPVSLTVKNIDKQETACGAEKSKALPRTGHPYGRVDA